MPEIYDKRGSKTLALLDLDPPVLEGGLDV